MYTAHYGLRRKPFQISSDAKFIWLGEKHKEALSTLRYGILDNKGFLLLTGDVGTGKTTLINALIASLSKDVIYASVPDPSLDKLDFFNYIAAAFGLGYEFSSKGKFLASFTCFLLRAYEEKKQVLLIIDESQLLTQELLEEIRLLSNIVTTDSNPLLNIFFVGQYEFNEVISRQENRAIAQRLTLNYYIEPLTAEETREYIKHRLRVAGTTNKIFTPSAVQEIYTYAKGFPRKINIICDHCLMSGYAEDKKTVTDAMVRESAKELEIPESRRGGQQTDASTNRQSALSPSLSAGQIGGQAGESEGQIKAEKIRSSWPSGSFFWIILLLMGLSLVFLYLTNSKYQEATAYLTSIQQKIDANGVQSAPVKSQPQPQVNKPVPETAKAQAALPVGQPPPAKKSSPVPVKKVQTEAGSTATNTSLKMTEKKSPAEKNVVETARSESQKMQATVGDEKKSSPAPSLPISGQPAFQAANTSEQKVADKPVIEPPPLPEKPLIIRFEIDSNIFSDSDIKKMEDFARIIKMYPGTTVTILGYTDTVGDEHYNRKLSEFRANMVKSFLLGQNLPPEKVNARGLGSKNPIDSNDTLQGRTMNRRVEIRAVPNRN